MRARAKALPARWMCRRRKKPSNSGSARENPAAPSQGWRGPIRMMRCPPTVLQGFFFTAPRKATAAPARHALPSRKPARRNFCGLTGSPLMRVS